jgi:hypothetical protein
MSTLADVPPLLRARAICLARRPWPGTPATSPRSTHQSRRKSLNRLGAKAVQTAVLVIDRCPSQAWIARVSWPLLARA